MCNVPFETNGHDSDGFISDLVTVDDDGDPTAGCTAGDYSRLMDQMKVRVTRLLLHFTAVVSHC